MTIKISQLTALTSMTNTTLMAVVDTDGPYITKRIDGSVLRDFFANVATTGNTAQLTVNSSLVPITDSMYNLGAAGSAFGELYTTGTFYTDGAIRNNAGIVSVSTSTGALTVVGGVGVTGNINAGNVTATNLTGHIATPAQNQITSLGTLTGLTSSGAINITATTGSDSTTTGALVVAGGLGVSGNIHIPGAYQLHVGSDIVSASFPHSIAQFNSSINDYQQVVMQNISSGATASSDYIAVADTGDDSSKYIDMGINSSGYSNPDYSIAGALDGYMYVNGGNLALGTQTSGKSIVFHTGGTQLSNLRARLSSTGLTVNATTATSSITTGALVVNGGIGVAGDMRVGGNIYAANLITTSTSTLSVSAPLVYMEASTPYPYSYDIGIFSAFTGGPANVYAHTGFVRNDTDGVWNLFSNVAEPAGGQVSLTNAIYDPIKTGAHTINSDAVTKLVNGGTSGVGNIGSSSGMFNTVFATKLQGTLTTPAQTAITSVGTLVGGTWNAATISVAYGGTGTTTNTGTGSVVLSNSPTLVTPVLGTPASGNLSNCTFPTLNQNTSGTAAGLSATLAVASGGTGTTTSTGTGSVVLSTGPTIATPTFTAPALGTPSSGNFSSGTFVWPTFNQNTSGSAASLSGVPSLTLASVTTPSITHSGGNGIGDIGSAGSTFATVYATTFSGVSTTAKYADIAENYQADAEYAPGTVLAFGGLFEVTLATDNTARVAGIVSTNPAHLMNTNLIGHNVVALALTGRVPCRVTGSIKKGDLMVAASDGFARATTSPQFGAVIGKALEDFEGTDGIIEVVVGRL